MSPSPRTALYFGLGLVSGALGSPARYQPTTAVPTPSRLSGRASGDSIFESSLHLSAALAGIVLLVFLEYRCRTGGYVLSRSCWSATDSLNWILMGLVAGVWTVFVFVSAYMWEGQGETPCRADPRGSACAARLAFVPWILDGVWLWWALRHGMHRLRRVWQFKRRPVALKPGIQEMCDAWITPSKFRSISPRWIPFRDRVLDWRLVNWLYSFPHNVAALLLWLAISGVAAWTAVGAFATQLYMLGMLVFAAIVVMFAYILYPSTEPLVKAEHVYAMDDIRVPLHSPVELGMVYVLPSKHYGFDVSYSQKLQSEQTALEPLLKVTNRMHMIPDWTLEKCRASTREWLTAQVQRVEGDTNGTRDLAYWLFWHGQTGEDRPSDNDRLWEDMTEGLEGSPLWEDTVESLEESPEERALKKWRTWLDNFSDMNGCRRLLDRSCRLREGYKTLLGRDTALALLLWEHLVFERRWELQQEYGDLLTAGVACRLRTLKHMGPTVMAGVDRVLRRDVKTRGSTEGIEGLYEAVGEMYRILGYLDEVSTDRSVDIDSSASLQARSSRCVPDDEEAQKDGVVMSVAETPPVSTNTPSKLRQLFDVIFFPWYEAIESPASCPDSAARGKQAVRDVLEDLEDRGVLPKKFIIKDLFDPPPPAKCPCSGAVADPVSPPRPPPTVKEYAAALWNRCWATSPSTFGALHLWATVWYLDVGDVGFHATPLVPHGGVRHWDDEASDYMTVWRVPWRSSWTVAVRCQFLVLLPTLLSAASALAIGT